VDRPRRRVCLMDLLFLRRPARAFEERAEPVAEALHRLAVGARPADALELFEDVAPPGEICALESSALAAEEVRLFGEAEGEGIPRVVSSSELQHDVERSLLFVVPGHARALTLLALAVSLAPDARHSANQTNQDARLFTG
jgi:hypothetical protein